MTDLFAAVDVQAHGDVVRSDAGDLLRSISDDSVSAIITDPPYGIGYHSNYYKNRNPHARIAQDWNFQIGAFFDEVARILVDGGALYLFTRWDVYPLWAKEIPKAIALKNAIIWEKDNWSSGDLTGNFGNQYEIIMFLTKGRHCLRGRRWPNIWKFSRIAAGRLRMPAEKPVGIYERAILSSTDEGALIVDPFCGSGTAGEAAIRCNRRFLLGDMDPKMIAVARQRLGLAIEPFEPNGRPPRCPVFNIDPPDISLWGLHPEDVLHAKG